MDFRISAIENYNDREVLVIEKKAQAGHWYRIGDTTRYSDGKVFFHSTYGKLSDDAKQFVREQKRGWFPKFWASRDEYSEEWLSTGINFATDANH